MKGGGKCVGDPINISGYQIGDYYIGECAYVSNFYIYKVCTQSIENDRLTDCNELLVKVYKLQFWVTTEKVEFERDIMLKINDLNIAPRFYGLHIITRDDSKYALLVMEHYGSGLENSGTLDDLLKEDISKDSRTNIKVQIKQLLDTLYTNHYQYNDLHSNNFLYKKLKNGKYKFKIIDFEDIEQIPPDKPVDKKYKIEIVSTGEIFDVSTNGGKRKTFKTKRK